MNDSTVWPNRLGEFCRRHGRDPETAIAMNIDASTRRYFRIAGPKKIEVLMDASDEPYSVEPFVRVANILRNAGLSAPEIFHRDCKHGFLLLEDLGPDTLTAAEEKGAAQNQLFDLAVDALIKLHRLPPASEMPELPWFDAGRFLEQSQLFLEMIPRLGFTGSVDREGYRAAVKDILAAGLAVPNGVLLRDYHGQNIIWRPDQTGLAKIGILDFQDAGWGPVTYDLVSLMEDARRDLPSELLQRGENRYLAANPNIDKADFEASLHVMAAIRHMRILAVFARLAKAGKTDYLSHLERVGGQLARHLSTPQLAPLRDWFLRHPLDPPISIKVD